VLVVQYCRFSNKSGDSGSKTVIVFFVNPVFVRTCYKNKIEIKL